jgi:glycolate oxidase iron-sulfur subunit
VQHEINVEQYGPRGETMADVIGSCVHCGFCLPTCPTYVTMGEEMDSPRGRIFLMKEVLEGRIELEDALPYVDNCLGCQSCRTACPSGVEYGDLLTSFRAHAEPERDREPMERVQRAMVLKTLPFPKRFRLAARAGRLAKPFADRLPSTIGAMLRLLPAELPKAPPLPTVFAAQGERRARVALLAGCAQRVLEPDINWATLRVLSRNGIETVIPPGQGCCGALAMHTGAAEAAKPFARRNIDAFAATGIDAVITNAAGCGSGMKEYPLLFKGAPEGERARLFAEQVIDVAAFLDRLGLREAPPALTAPRITAYHDACHLAHAQGVRSAPRRLLEGIEGLRLVEPAEWELCCGSAGTYNIERPTVAAELGERKARNLIATGAELIATGNIGCMTQVQTHVAELGHHIPVLHTMQVLDRAYTRTLFLDSA